MIQLRWFQFFINLDSYIHNFYEEMLSKLAMYLSQKIKEARVCVLEMCKEKSDLPCFLHGVGYSVLIITWAVIIGLIWFQFLMKVDSYRYNVHEESMDIFCLELSKKNLANMKMRENPVLVKWPYFGQFLIYVFCLVWFNRIKVNVMWLDKNVYVWRIKWKFS